MAEITTNIQLVQLTDLVNFAKKSDSLYIRKSALAEEVDAKIRAKIGSVYTAGGSVESIDALPALEQSNIGKVVNISEDFVTNANFLDKPGEKYPAGTNVAVVEDSEGNIKYDAMSGLVDLSGYVLVEDMETALANKVTSIPGAGLISDAQKIKLENMEIADPAVVAQAIEDALNPKNPVTPDPEEDEPAE